MPKLLWFSPFSLHDTSSGAAIDSHYMLKTLQKHGFEVWAFSSFAFDAKTGSEQAFGNLEEMFSKDSSEIFVFDEDGIHFVYSRCLNTEEKLLSLSEAQRFYGAFCEVLAQFEPDVVMGYGVSPYVMNCFAEAKAQGYSTVYSLHNATHNAFLYPNIDLVTTNSQAAAQLVAERDEINAVAVTNFFEVKDVVSPERQKRYVTMVNPADHKGVAIFAKLAHMCKDRMPEVEFLVVNTRQHFTDSVALLHTKDRPNHHPFKATDFPNVFMVGSQSDMRAIYAVTNVLLAPSLWFETWGRVVTEAVLNGIPVVASDRGGIPEAMAGGGYCIPVPQHCQDDYNSLPDDVEIEPWFEALKKALNPDSKLNNAMAQAKESLVPEAAAVKLVSALAPLMRRTKQRRALMKEMGETKALSPFAQQALKINDLADHELSDITFD